MKKTVRLLTEMAFLCVMLMAFAVPAFAANHDCGTWQEVSDAINNDSDQIIYINITNDMTADFTIEIDKKCKIELDGKEKMKDYYIYGNGSCRAFYLEEDEISLLNSSEIHYKNFGGSEEGSAIYVEGDSCSVVDGMFENCSAGSGGAIYLDGYDDVVSGCCFIGNYAGDGGAIYVDDDARILSCNFFDNFASMDGGSIYDNNSAGTVTVWCCSFNGGSCGGDGIWVYCNGDAILERCTPAGEAYYDDPDEYDDTYTGSSFSEGIVWIVIAIAVIAVAAGTIIIIKKKKDKEK